MCRWVIVRSVASATLTDTIQWSKTFQDISYHDDSVAVHFEDRTSCHGSIVIACDGSRSRVRKSLYPSSYLNHSLPVQLLGATTRYSVEQAAAVRDLDPYFFQGTHSESNVYLYFSCECTSILTTSISCTNS